MAAHKSEGEKHFGCFLSATRLRSLFSISTFHLPSSLTSIMSTTTIVDDLEQLSTATSRSETPTPERQESNVDAASKVLQVPKGPAPQEARLRRTLKPIHGLRPHDEPLEHDATLSILDRRTVASLSIRYRCVKDKGYVTDCALQDQTIRSVWTRLRQILAEEFKQKHLPSVVFEVQQDADGRYFPCIDIALPNVKAFLAVRSKLDKIEVQGEGKEAFTFAQHNWQNTLPPDVLPFDILRFPLAEASLDVFFASMKHMAFPVGTALGAGLVCVSEAPSEEASSANIIRVYLKLSQDAMRLKTMELVDRLPSKFEWKGVAYTCHLAGQKLRHWPKVSASYPLQESAPAAAAAPASASMLALAPAASKRPVTARHPTASASEKPAGATSVGSSADAGTPSTSQAVPAVNAITPVSPGTGAATSMSSSFRADPAAQKSTVVGTGVRSSVAPATRPGASRTASSRTQEQEEAACTPA